MTAHMTDLFFNVAKTVAKTSEGDVDLPILYFDTTNLIAFFLCEQKRVRQILSGTGYQPALNIGNKSVIGISLYEYRKTSVGVYNEVGLAVPVIREQDKAPLSKLVDLFSDLEKRKVGFYVVDLPVTTKEANAAGREIWGYPKFITEIPFSLKGRNFTCTVKNPDSDGVIMTLSGQIGLGVTTPPMDIVTYTKLDGRDIRTTVNVRGKVKLSLAGSLQLSVGDSPHPMAEHMRLLGLNGKKPIAVQYTDKFQSRLNEGRKL